MTIATNRKETKSFRPVQDRYYSNHTSYQTQQKPSFQSERTQPSVEKWVAISLATLFIIFAVWWLWEPIQTLTAVLTNQDAVSATLKSYGALGPLILAIAQLIQVIVAIIPGHVFLVAGGYVYGFPLGFLMNLLFVVAASQCGFLLARRAGRPFVNRFASPELVSKWETIAEEKGVLFFTIAFVLPVFPTDVMNFVAGLTGMSSRKFLIANFFGRLPGVIMLTLIGSHGLVLSSTSWAIMGVIVAIIYITGRTFISRIESRYSSRAIINDCPSVPPSPQKTTLPLGFGQLARSPRQDKCWRG
ncbi:MAG: TVP38/TMEM64 family protein [Chloroflexi bacterium]|nr:TVP38/TMEM64 family protein [Chloroflexota bacterium]